MSGFLEISISLLGNYVDWSKWELNWGVVDLCDPLLLGMGDKVRGRANLILVYPKTLSPGMKFFVLDERTFT